MKLFKSITILCGTDIIMRNTPHDHTECGGIFYWMLSVPQTIVMDMNNVMLISIGMQLVLKGRKVAVDLNLAKEDLNHHA